MDDLIDRVEYYSSLIGWTFGRDEGFGDLVIRWYGPTHDSVSR